MGPLDQTQSRDHQLALARLLELSEQHKDVLRNQQRKRLRSSFARCGRRTEVYGFSTGTGRAILSRGSVHAYSGR